MPLNFTLEGLNSVRQALDRIDQFLDRLKNSDNSGAEEFPIEETLRAFMDAVNQDLNFPKAFAILFDMIRDVNKGLDQKKLSQHAVKKILSSIEKLDRILGCLQKEEQSVPETVLELVEARQLARRERRFQDADKIRNEIIALGYELEDVTNGTKVKKRHPCNIQKNTVTD
jgi:cysteinyl-tRNA synthetase